MKSQDTVTVNDQIVSQSIPFEQKDLDETCAPL